ncbi:E3 ubiquitin-protein ligase RNF180-like [Palaemon carinicauda]|uniref:E3 ubiquitin-protein ligase RNF180-like n=1 Tax=Palaemon carinicauda TaxID=392227 RepID=UPI0035B65028
MTEDTVRCRKCRKVLLADPEGLLNAHGQKHQGGRDCAESTECTLMSEKSCLYLSEDSYPQFITDALDTSSWTKGKLNCPACQARIGSFNYVSGSHCTCGSHIVPQVHLLVSKVDVRHATEVLPNPISYPNCPVALTEADIKTLPIIETSDCNSVAALPSPVLQQLCDEENPSTSSSSKDMQLQDSIGNVPLTSSVAHQNESPRKRIRGQARLRQRQKHVTSTESDFQSMQSDGKASSFCASLSSDKESSDEDENNRWFEDIPPHLTCSVCLDLLYSPFVAQPCCHVFCEPCLRRLARPNPTKTCCPLCRQIIGQCMPSRDLAAEVREKYPDEYEERHKFEQKHNMQHSPLPWLRNFRMDQTDVYRGGLVQMAGGWRPVLMLLALNALGLGSMIFLKWYLHTENLGGGPENQEIEGEEFVL